MIYITGIVPLILAELAAFGWCAFAISRITTLPRTASVYCAIWVHMTTLSAYELWQLLLWVFDDGGRRIVIKGADPEHAHRQNWRLQCSEPAGVGGSVSQ